MKDSNDSRINQALDLAANVRSWTQDHNTGVEVNDFAEEPEDVATYEYEIRLYEADIQGHNVCVRQAVYDDTTIKGERSRMTCHDLFLDEQLIGVAIRDKENTPIDPRIKTLYERVDREFNRVE